jgi:hypothetical protein
MAAWWGGGRCGLAPSGTEATATEATTLPGDTDRADWPFDWPPGSVLVSSWSHRHGASWGRHHRDAIGHCCCLLSKATGARLPTSRPHASRDQTGDRTLAPVVVRKLRVQKFILYIVHIHWKLEAGSGDCLTAQTGAAAAAASKHLLRWPWPSAGHCGCGWLSPRRGGRQYAVPGPTRRSAQWAQLDERMRRCVV